jgi:STE24 endopeptidase
MDVLHTLLSNIQHKLAFVAVEPINWKLYVQAFSWSVGLFESYLLYVFPFVFSVVAWR